MVDVSSTRTYGEDGCFMGESSKRVARSSTYWTLWLAKLVGRATVAPRMVVNNGGLFVQQVVSLGFWEPYCLLYKPVTVPLG